MISKVPGMSDSSTPSSQSQVQTDLAKGKKFAIYFAALSVAGAALIVVAALQHWGFAAYMGGGVLLFAGVGGYAGLKKTGGVGKVACPACQVSIDVMQVGVHRYVACPGCDRWLEGAQTMRLVGAGHVAPTPVFRALLLEGGPKWPRSASGALMNPSGGAEPATGLKEIKGTRVSAAAMVSPVSVRRVITLEVPASPDDATAIDVEVGPPAAVLFRSFDYFQAFKAANPGA